MKKLALVFALVAPLAACGGGAAGEILKKMKDTKAKVCACTDEACVTKVKEDVKAWMEKNESKFKSWKPSKAQAEVLDKLDDEIDKCAEKFEKKPEPPPPPPPPVEPPPAAGSGTDPAAGSGTAAPADPAAGSGTAAPAPAAGSGTAAPAAPANP